MSALMFSGFETEYEALYGTKPNPELCDFVRRLEDACEKFERRGRGDSMNGFAASSKETFVEGWNKVFNDDPELAEVMGELLWMSYMDGYRSVGEVVCLEGGATP